MDHDETPSDSQAAEEHVDRVFTIRIEPSSVWRIIGTVLVTLFALWVIGEASHLLVLLALSFFFSLALQPAVMRLVERYGWRRGSAVGVIYLVGIAIVVLMLAVIIPALVTLAQTIEEHAPEWIANVTEWLESTFNLTVSESFSSGTWADEIDDALISWARSGGVGNILGIATSGLSLLFDVATIAMFTFYFTADSRRLQKSVLSLVSPQNQYRIGWTWDQAILQTGGYFYSRIILMLINGFGFFVTMVVVGVPVIISIPLAMMGAFIAAFIPAVGTYLGSAIPIAVTLGLSGIIPAAVVLGYALVYQQIENYWLSPKISAKTMTLNGAVAFGAALAGGAIAGPIGAFVALPVAALITSLVSNFVDHHEVTYSFADAVDESAGAAMPGSQESDA